MKYIVKILPGPDCNPEYAPDKELQDGIECNGCLAMLFGKNNNLKAGIMQSVSCENIANAVWDHTDDEFICSIREGVAVAEGYIRSNEIWEQHGRRKRMNGLLDVLGLNKSDDDGDEDDDQEDEE